MSLATDYINLTTEIPIMKNSKTAQGEPEDRFPSAHQLTMLGSLIALPEIYNETSEYLRDFYFESTIRAPVRFINDHYKAHGALPSHAVLRTRFPDTTIPEFSPAEANASWLKSELPQFARYKALEIAVLDGVDHLQSGRQSELLQGVLDASQIGIAEDDDDFLWINETHTVRPPEFLIRPWLVRDTVCAVYGAGGSYKSFWCLHAALCIASGTPFNGSPVKRGSVAYIAAEGQAGLALRVEGWKAGHPDVRFDDSDFVLMKKPIQLMDPASVTYHIDRLKKMEKKRRCKFDLIVLDTLSQCIAGADEDKAQSMTVAVSAMIRIRREFDCTVIFVHHSGKDAARRMRGSGALENNTDSMIEVTADKDELTATAHVRRHKDCPDGMKIDFWVERQVIPHLRDHEMGTSLVVRFAEEAEQNEAGAERSPMGIMMAREILRVLKAGESISVRQLLKRLGKPDSMTYKQKLAACLPLDQVIDVLDDVGGVIGQLRRKTATNSPYGDVECIEHPNTSDVLASHVTH
jgi:hypothetical protein